MPDSYRTLGQAARAEIKVKGSRFIGEAMGVEDAEAAEIAIAAIRKREHAATHHCVAYRLGPAGEAVRYHDDGEPSGTAGLPLLRQIEARDLTDTLVVVTRYYGGTKLGTGGLARAYAAAAAEALDAARVEEVTLRHCLRLRFGYEDISPAMHTLGLFDAEILATHYSEETELVVGVRRSQTDAFIEAFVNALGGRGTAVRDDLGD